MQRKTNPALARAIYLAKKKNLVEIAEALSKAKRSQIKINLTSLNNSKNSKVIVPGKILSSGNINKKLEVAAFSYSGKAK